MSDDLVSKRRAERCTTHHHACDCREYAHAQEIAEKDAAIAVLTATNEDLREAILRVQRKAEDAEARIADAPTVCADTDNIVEIANSLGYYHGTRVALVVVND